MTRAELPLRPRLFRQLRRNADGTTSVEFALVAPVLFLIIFGGIQFGELLWTQSALHFAVQEAARCASVTPSTCGTASQIAAYAASETTGLGLSSSVFTATTASCGHQVSASYQYTFVTPTLLPFTPTLTAQACFQ
jgi:Flp pilus assembly protein TadG